MMETTMQTVTTNEIEQITAEIIAYEGTMVQSAWEIGQRLIKAKGLLEHGAWSAWLTQRVNFSERKAQSYMRLAREYPNPQPVAGLGIRKALALLEVPAEEREAFAQEHDAERISARELEVAIREREAAEASRLEMERSLQIANQSIDGLTEQIAQQRKELEELRNKPTEVAVETVVDEAAVKAAAKKAREKAEAKAAKKLAELEKQLEELKANDSTERAKRAEAELEVLKKELAISRNEDVAGVQMCFEQMKQLGNRAQGHIKRLEARGQMEEMEKCKAALAAMGQALLKLAGKG